MSTKFSIVYKGSNFDCELDKNGLVWIVQDDELESKTNNGQVKPAMDLNEAKEIAELMLHSIGY